MNAIEIAIRMETDAIKFYREASERCSNSVGKKMFLSIMEDEKRHLDALNEILKGLDISIKDISPLKKIKTVFEELRDEMMKKVQATQDELEAFRIAMHMENEGIEFYKKMSSEARSEKERSLFQRLVKEEEQHYSIFSNTYFYLSQTGSWFMWEEHSIVDGGTSWA